MGYRTEFEYDQDGKLRTYKVAGYARNQRYRMRRADLSAKAILKNLGMPTDWLNMLVGTALQDHEREISKRVRRTKSQIEADKRFKEK